MLESAVSGGSLAESAASGCTGSAADITIAVIDTNVLLDWLVFVDPRLDPLRRAMADGRLRWITCARMLDEFAHVLGREPLNTRVVDREQVDRQIHAHARQVDHRHEPRPPGWPRLTPRCSDPDDQIFIDLAIAQRAQLLLTRDRALLKLARKALVHGVWVTTPERWAARP
jgi:putative PIN family toxin of toxin-antitoxin system